MPWDFDYDQPIGSGEMMSVPVTPKEMLRYNTGKPRLSLLPTAFVLVVDRTGLTALAHETARVMDYGATKYAMNNWRAAGPWLKVLDSGLRHLDKLLHTSETVDDESGIHHAGHLGCNLAFLLEFIRENDGTDDRFVTKTRLSGSPLKGLEAIQAYILDWKDGGPHQSLEQAVELLAVWYETNKEV